MIDAIRKAIDFTEGKERLDLERDEMLGPALQEFHCWGALCSKLFPPVSITRSKPMSLVSRTMWWMPISVDCSRPFPAAGHPDG